MAASGLTIEKIYEFFKENGNLVKNRDLVRYFKGYLTDPASKDDARIKFREYVNILAQTKTQGDEKFLLLKTKYLKSLEPRTPEPHYPPTSPQFTDPRLSIGIPVSPAHSDFNSSPSKSPGHRQPPPYRPPPPVTSPSSSLDNVSLYSFSSEMSQNLGTPQPPPRRRSIDKQKLLEDEQSSSSRKLLEDPSMKIDGINGDDKQSVSVKERTQKFNRLASVEDELSSSPRQPKSAEKPKTNKEVDEDDGASVTSLEPKKCMEWCVTASKGDLQELVKLAKDEPRLVNRKDPFTTVLHWGAKHGNAEIIKVFAGRYKVDVNGRTNGGYTALHLAAQFGHKDVFKLLIEVYKADAKIRDYSGRMPDYYLIAKEQRGIKDTIRKIKGRKKQAEKDLGFLRIGSLNVRVKKTTEAFSNFLGVGGGSVNPLDYVTDKMHKGWGSADNLNQDNTKGTFVKKKSKRPLEVSDINSTPGTPLQMPRKFAGHDSDSDSAAGFDSQWKN